VEYSFPPLLEGDPHACPAGWKYLPTLALPDGSHNYDEDTVFFHLPSLSDPKQTVYGISCYRQIPVEVCAYMRFVCIQNKCRIYKCLTFDLKQRGHTRGPYYLLPEI
jgi:hypothetical protein